MKVRMTELKPRRNRNVVNCQMMHNDTKIMGPDHEFDTTSWTLIRAVGDVNASLQENLAAVREQVQLRPLG